MKNTTQQILIYDKDCPLCCWYTQLFIRKGLLSESGRIPFNEAVNNPNLQFDHQLSKNKIALVDFQSGSVTYGIDSLLAILGKRFGWMETIGKFPPINWLLTLLYSFISYNRKVIVPSRCATNCECVPERNYYWRVAFIVFCGLIVNLATGLYFGTQLSAFFIGNPFYSDLLFFSAQLGFQFVAFKLLRQINFYDYAGQVSFVSLLGALLLLFFHYGLQVLHTIGIQTAMLAPLCYGIVYMFMLYEHARRLRILQLSGWLSVSWVLFRFCIYPFAFQLHL
jgi:predicted DCC family thiol-disulfide oxidoreductase YuxK